MTSKERMLSVINGEKPDRIPFSPAIYEHKAVLINRLPSGVCRDTKLLVESVKTEYKTYHPDILVVGIDIYNVEAEALSCEINYEYGISVPNIKTRKNFNPSTLIIKNIEEIETETLAIFKFK
jgi:uroporphyrinogen decarboxylase